jgi:hypothetical protein
MTVSVEDFIPSLAGYVQSLDITTALRLCNRYGRGPSCHVNKLPTELIELIEAHVHIAMRQSALVEWKQQKQCAEGKCACDYDEHWPVDRKELHRSLLMKDRAAKRPIDEVEDDQNLHTTNIRNFSLRTRGFRALDADARLVKKYFGLDIWTPIMHSYDVHPGDVRLRPLLSRPGPPGAQSQLFFMLPGFLRRKCGSEYQRPTSFSTMDRDFAAEPCPGRTMMRRFLRVFRMLGLLPDGNLCLLEKVVNLSAFESTDESNAALRKRISNKLAELGEGRIQHAIDGKVLPDILHVQRSSSWESRMQSAWLAKEDS